LHDRDHLNVAPELYEIWRRCLLETLREVDPEYTEALAERWREVIRPGLEKMKAMYTPAGS
jgi:hemoglobin-like flavoprotein